MASASELPMKEGQIFWYDGAYWMAHQIIREHNQCFTWLKVIVKWSCFGPRPNWANEDRTFLMFRKPLTKKTFRV